MLEVATKIARSYNEILMLVSELDRSFSKPFRRAKVEEVMFLQQMRKRLPEANIGIKVDQLTAEIAKLSKVVEAMQK